LAHLTVVAGSKSSKKRIPKLAIDGKECARTADKKSEQEELIIPKSLRSILIELAGISALGCSFRRISSKMSFEFKPLTARKPAGRQSGKGWTWPPDF
jgi:hypothetical protein